MVSETSASFIKTSLSVSDILQLFRLLISCLSSSVGRSSLASVIHRNLSILSVRRNLPTNSILTLRPFVSFRCCQRRKVCQHPLSSVNGSAASSLGVLFSWCCSELTVEQILMIKPGSSLMFTLCLHVQLREVQQNLGCCFTSSGALVDRVNPAAARM